MFEQIYIKLRGLNEANMAIIVIADSDFKYVRIHCTLLLSMYEVSHNNSLNYIYILIFNSMLPVVKEPVHGQSALTGGKWRCGQSIMWTMHKMKN